jgi:hypothetical protein
MMPAVITFAMRALALTTSLFISAVFTIGSL